MIVSLSKLTCLPSLYAKLVIKFLMTAMVVNVSIFWTFAAAQTLHQKQQTSQPSPRSGQLSSPYSLAPKASMPSHLSRKKQPTATHKTPLTSDSEPRELSTSASLGHSGISVEELKQIDPNSLGTMTFKQGGFGINMWEGVSRSEVERLMPSLPVNSRSKTMRNLMRRLLLSAAKAPDGRSLNPKSRDLIATRVELLVSMGDIPAATMLIKEVPTSALSERILRSKVDSLFMRNDNARVCSLVASQIRDVETAYWQKAFIFCQSLKGEVDKASLGASLLRETGDNDEVFYGLLDQMSGFEKYQVASLIDPEPLYFAMVRAAKAELPADVTSSNNPAILRTIAISPNARPELRLDAAERAEAMGALNTEVLRQLYAGVTFSDSALENTLSSADAEGSPLSRALLYRKALVESVPAATAEVLAKAFELARQTGRYQSMARVYLPILRGIKPTQDFIWFAPEAIRALSAAGDLRLAKLWFSTLRPSSELDENVANIRNEIGPLARLAGALEGDEWRPEMIADWWARASLSLVEKPKEAELAHNRAALIYNLLEGLGDEVPDAEWEVLMDGPFQVSTTMPHPAIWRSLEMAASNSRIGETVLLCLLALGNGGPVQANPIVLRKVLLSLRKIGLENEARALALEAAIASGL